MDDGLRFFCAAKEREHCVVVEGSDAYVCLLKSGVTEVLVIERRQVRGAVPKNRRELMKNRIWNKAAGLGMSAVLLAAACGNGGYVPEIWAAEVDNPGIILTESAQWTDLGQYRAEIVMTVSGLRGYAEKFTQAPVEDLPEENPEEIPKDSEGEADTEQNEESEPNISEDSNADSNDIIIDEIETPEAESELREETVDMIENSAGEYEQMTSYMEDWEEETGVAEADILWDEEEQEAELWDLEDSLDWGALSMQSIPQLELVSYISEYFRPDTEFISQSCYTEEIPVRNQNGADTTITKAVWSIDCQTFTEDIFQISFPIILREEYRSGAGNLKYPVSQDEPLMKDCPGTGTFVFEKTESGSALLGQTASPVLEVPAAVSDFAMELKTDAADVKAGQPYTYELNVTNTGEVPLSDILIKSSFSIEEIKAVWESESGVQVNGKQAMITTLGKGETRILHMTAKPTEDQSGALNHTVYAQTYRPGSIEEIISHETETGINITPLKADFTVEKTADRTEAYPGDTITYQICIKNTGERTLHSVLSTERFLDANIQAQFMPKEGVALNSTRTQALIKEIAPGEAFGLLATVTLPKYFQNQELVNQVTVVTEETGSRSVQSQSEISVAVPFVTPTEQLYDTQTYYQSDAMTKNAYAAASKPKTGDNTDVGLFVVLLIFAVMSAAGIIYQKK